jgi:hypothetical protein
MADGLGQMVGRKVLIARGQCTLLVLVAMVQVEEQGATEEKKEGDIQGQGNCRHGDPE